MINRPALSEYYSMVRRITNKERKTEFCLLDSYMEINHNLNHFLFTYSGQGNFLSNEDYKLMSWTDLKFSELQL